MIGQKLPNLTGGVAEMLANHHLTKPVLIGEIRADGQFDIISQTEPVAGDAWTDFLPEAGVLGAAHGFYEVHVEGDPAVTTAAKTALTTFGISIALQQVLKNVFGTQARPPTSPVWLDGAWVLNDLVSIRYIRVAIFVLALVFLGFLLWLMKRTRLGLEVRAVTQNPTMSASMGLNLDRINMLTFGLGSGISGIAGVAIGGRGRLYGAVIGAAAVSLLSSWFTGGRAPSIPLGFGALDWVDWWRVLLGLDFVAVTLFAPKGIGGVFDRLAGVRTPDRKGAALGRDDAENHRADAALWRVTDPAWHRF